MVEFILSSTLAFMHNIWILVICFVVGFILKSQRKIPENSHRTINAIILHISLPAQILLFVPKITFNYELLLPAGMAWIVFFFVFGVLLLLRRFQSFPEKTFGCLLLTAGLGNTSFLGLPMIEAFWGKEFNSIGILCDQPGTFLALSIVGIPLALNSSSPSLSILLKKVFSFPPFLFFLLALVFSSFEFPKTVVSVLQVLGNTLAPLALFSVGIQFQLGQIKSIRKELLIGLSLKMIFAPIVIFLLYILILKNQSMYSKISIFESAMPPMITGGIIAIENDLKPELASAMIAVGVLFSLISIPLWYFLLSS